MAKTSRADQAAERRARVEELRRADQARERRRTLMVVGALAVAVVVIIAVVAIALSRSGDSSTAGPNESDQIIPAAVPGGTETVQPMPKSVPNKTGIDGVLAWDTTGYPGDGQKHVGAIGHDHVDGPVQYAVLPPVGGPHNQYWMNAGTYTKPIPSERAVHNLEHGAVWIVYNPDLPAAQITQLEAFVAKQSMIDEADETSPGQANRYVDLSPWATNVLPAPIVISSWGYQLRVTSPTDPRLQKFIDLFRNNPKYSPEFGSPVDGIPIETGGRPAAAGSKNENPPGAVTS